MDEERLGIKCRACYRLGLRSLRDRWSWAGTNPEPGAFDFSRYQTAAQAQHDAGLDVYQISHSTPAWATVPATESLRREAYPPQDPRDYYKAVRRLIRALDGQLRYYEPWNEPEIHFFLGYVWDFAALCKASYLACKDEDPGIGVLWGSRCAPALFWRRALENGCGPYFEIFNQHSYGAPEKLFELIQEDRDLMAEFGLMRSIWMTEMGRRTDPDPDGGYIQAEREQVSYLLRAHACGFGAGLERFHYFYLQEFLEYGVWLWGLMRDDLTPKPALLALGTLIRQLREARTTGYLQRAETYCVVFERATDDYVGMAWSLENGSLSLAVGDGATLVSAMGKTIRELPAGTISLDLDDQPVYIRGIDPTAMDLSPVPDMPHHKPGSRAAPELYVWLQAIPRPDQPYPSAEEMAWHKLQIPTEAGREEAIAFRIHNYGAEDAAVDLTLDLPEDWQLLDPATAKLTVAAHTSEELLVRLVVGKGYGGCTFSVGARLALDGRARDRARVYYHVD